MDEREAGIGTSTASEIEYAQAAGKPVRYLEPESLTTTMPARECIPTKPHSKLNWNAFVFYVCQVPAGKCITDKNLLRFLRQVYYVDQLDFDFENRPLESAIDRKIPLWRCLSARGVVYQPKYSFVDYKKNLLDEGHELYTRGNGNRPESEEQAGNHPCRGQNADHERQFRSMVSESVGI